MTFKHINFYDSTVMRELERQAVKKGTFKSNSVADVVKTASVKKSFVPTDDLQTDLLNLAAGLRARGFVKEADVLEDKIFIKKQAESHLYRAIDEDGEDVINFAHPDGDAKVTDAQNQEGVVETILSQHKKMQDVATKQPTGKYAKLINDVILATADILEVDLVKMAAGEEEDEELLSGKPGKKKGTIQAANKFISENSAKISGLLKDGIAEFQPANWKFTEEALVVPGNEELRNKYVSLAKGIKAQDILSWGEKSKTFGVGDNRVANLASTIMSMSKSSSNLAEWANKAAPGLGAKYFSGSQPSKDKEMVKNTADLPDNIKSAMTSPYFADNPDSVWKFEFSTWNMSYSYSVDYNKVVIAARAIDQALTAFHDGVLGADKLTAASVAFANEAKVYFDGLAKAAAFYDSAPEVPEDADSFLTVLQPLSEMSDYLKKYTVNGDNGKKLMSLVKTGGWDWTPKAFDSVTESLKINQGVIDHLNKNSLVPGDSLISDNKAADLFLSTAKMYHQVLPNTKDPKAAAKYKKYMRATLQLYKLLSGAKGKPFREIADQIKKMYPKATSYDKLLQEAQTWAKESAAMTGQAEPTDQSTEQINQSIEPANQSVDTSTTASAKAQGISKKAAPPGEAAGSAPGAQAPGKGPTSGGASSGEMQAVKLMQDTMNSLGQSLEQSGTVDRAELMKLRNSGQGPNTVSGDGVWGPRTTTALETANKLFNLNLVTVRNPASATRDAQNNYNNLKNVQGVGGANQSSNVVFDTLPNRIEWTGEVADATYEGGNIKLTKNDMANPLAMYDFLVKNGLQQPETVGATETNLGEEGFKPRTWIDIANWFIKRSVFKYNAVKAVGKEAADTARQYYDSATKLRQQLLNMGVYKAINRDDVVISGAWLKSNFGGSGQAGGARGRGQGGDAGSSYQQQKGQRGRGAAGQGLEGNRTRMPGGSGEDNSPPITDIVDLSRTDWFDLPYDNLESPRLRLSDFQRVPGPRMAQAMFSSDAMDDAKSQKQVLDFMGFTPHILGWNKDLNSYVVKTREGGRMLAQDVPGFKETMGQVMSRSSTQQYQQFLNQLSKQLHDTYSQWSQNVSAGEDAAMKDYYTRWQQAIAKQYRDITKRRG